MSSWSPVNSPDLNPLRTQCDWELTHKVWENLQTHHLAWKQSHWRGLKRGQARWCVFAWWQDTQKWDSWNTEQPHFFTDLALKPSKGIHVLSFLAGVGNVSSHVLMPFFLLKANLLQHNGTILVFFVSLQMNICPENIALVLNVLEYIVYLPWSLDAYKTLFGCQEKKTNHSLKQGSIGLTFRVAEDLFLPVKKRPWRRTEEIAQGTLKPQGWVGENRVAFLIFSHWKARNFFCPLDYYSRGSPPLSKIRQAGRQDVETGEHCPLPGKFCSKWPTSSLAFPWYLFEYRHKCIRRIF